MGSAGGAGLTACGGGAGFGAGTGATGAGAGGGVGLGGGGGAGWYSGTGSGTGAGGVAFCFGAMTQPARKISNKPTVAREMAIKRISDTCDVGWLTWAKLGI